MVYWDDDSYFDSYSDSYSDTYSDTYSNPFHRVACVHRVAAGCNLRPAARLAAAARNDRSRMPCTLRRNIGPPQPVLCVVIASTTAPVLVHHGIGMAPQY